MGADRPRDGGAAGLSGAQRHDAAWAVTVPMIDPLRRSGGAFLPTPSKDTTMRAAPPRPRTARLAGLGLLALLAGCGNTVQTTSGADFIAARPEWSARFAARPADGPTTNLSGRAPSAVDRAVFEAANAEPLLRFPARIGLARLQRGSLTSVPQEEADAWVELVRARGAAYGEFVPVSPLIAQLTAVPAADGTAPAPVDTIRIGAARQHLDAVLIYEVSGTARDQATPLSVADLTIIGAFLVPSRALEGRATAAAMLVDVRNGYPYGTALAHGEQDGMWVNAGSGTRSRELARRAEVEAVQKLTGEVGTMLERLRDRLSGPAASRPAARGM